MGNIFSNLFSKPARLLPFLGSAAGTMLGWNPTQTNLLGAGIGALQGGTTGLWGDNNILGGAASGFGQSLLGRGLGSGVQNWMDNAPNTTFNQGFMSGLGESIPYGQKIGNAFGMNITPYNAPTSSFSGTPALNWGGTTSAGQQPNMTMLSGQPGYANPYTGQITPYEYATTPYGGQGYFNPNDQTFAPQLNAPSGGVEAVNNAVAQTAGSGLGAPAAEKNIWQKLMPSAALMLAGQAIPQPAYNVPSAADTYTDLVAKMKSGAIPQTSGPLGDAVQASLLKNINSPDTILTDMSAPYKQAVIDDLNAREADEIAMARTVHAQNGTSGGSDEWRTINDIQEKYATFRAQQLGAIEENLYNQKVNIYLSSISQAYGVDQANLQTLAGLTGTSIQEAAIKYGLKAQQVSDFRNAINQLAIGIASGAGQNTAASLLKQIIAKA